MVEFMDGWNSCVLQDIRPVFFYLQIYNTQNFKFNETKPNLISHRGEETSGDIWKQLAISGSNVMKVRQHLRLTWECVSGIRNVLMPATEKKMKRWIKSNKE